MKTWARDALLIGFLAIAPTAAWANEMIYSQAAFPVVAFAFLGWLIVGTVLALMRRISFMGAGAAVVVLFGLFIGKPDIVMYFWMFCLALQTVYCAKRRPGPDPRRYIWNLAFHGSFLGVVLVGGAIAKFLYWERMGGFAAWAGWMVEIKGIYLVVLVVLALPTILWFVLRHRKES